MLQTERVRGRPVRSLLLPVKVVHFVIELTIPFGSRLLNTQYLSWSMSIARVNG